MAVISPAIQDIGEKTKYEQYEKRYKNFLNSNAYNDYDFIKDELEEEDYKEFKSSRDLKVEKHKDLEAFEEYAHFGLNSLDSVKSS